MQVAVSDKVGPPTSGPRRSKSKLLQLSSSSRGLIQFQDLESSKQQMLSATARSFLSVKIAQRALAEDFGPLQNPSLPELKP